MGFSFVLLSHFDVSAYLVDMKAYTNVLLNCFFLGFLSCYANAVLQCLAFTQPLTSYLLQGLHSRACKSLFIMLYIYAYNVYICSQFSYQGHVFNLLSTNHFILYSRSKKGLVLYM